MLCRHCETRARVTGPMRAWSPDRHGERRCTRCGERLGAADLTQRVREKESQLERFGLAGRTTPITTPVVPDDAEPPAPRRRRS